jgi:hypothetical protein
MSQPEDTDRGLAADARFEEALARVAFEPGMLLGVEATRSEQDYHRRRLNRHAYWLHGSGTVCGLAVAVTAEDPGNDTDQVLTRLLVSPGIGIDGLGREVSVHEPYCIDLTAWLTTQFEDEDLWGALVRDGYEPADQGLWLKVTMRYQDVASGLQPVMANEPNAGTDPVEPSRVKDCVLFELQAERPGDAPPGYRPFAAHGPLPADVEDRLSVDELAAIAGAAGAERRQLELASRLLFLLPGDNTALALSDDRTEAVAAAARVLLARVALRLTPAQELIVNPRRIRIDNLARPFVLGAGALAWLARNP